MTNKDKAIAVLRKSIADDLQVIIGRSGMIEHAYAELSDLALGYMRDWRIRELARIYGPALTPGVDVDIDGFLWPSGERKVEGWKKTHAPLSPATRAEVLEVLKYSRHSFITRMEADRRDALIARLEAEG